MLQGDRCPAVGALQSPHADPAGTELVAWEVQRGHGEWDVESPGPLWEATRDLGLLAVPPPTEVFLCSVSWWFGGALIGVEFVSCSSRLSLAA